MSEVNGKTLSISFRIDEGVIEHNNRFFIAKNVDGERVQDKNNGDLIMEKNKQRILQKQKTFKYVLAFFSIW